MISTPQILLVEDDPGDVRLALAVLRKLNMENRALIVGDGEEAMDFLYSRGKFAQRTSGLPAFILLDLKLPRVNGFDLLKQIKSDSKLKSIPIVVLTSSDQERDVELAYRLGANGYVVKSIDFTSYMATLRAVALYWLNVNEPPALVSECRALRRQTADFYQVISTLSRIWQDAQQLILRAAPGHNAFRFDRGAF
jgi:CheY-like chemotaxis protein